MKTLHARIKLLLSLTLFTGLAGWMALADESWLFYFKSVRAAQSIKRPIHTPIRNASGGQRLNLNSETKEAVAPIQSQQEPTNVTRQSTATAQTFAELIAKAQATGPVRVILGLRASFQPEGTLDSLAVVETQRLSIAQVQKVLLSLMAASNVTAVKQFAYIPFLAMEVDAVGLQYLQSSPDVTSIQEDMQHSLSLAESVPLIGAPAAWASGFTGSGQTVAILDTGVDKNHSFLTGKVVSEACYSTTFGLGTTSVCPGGLEQSTAPGSGVNCAAGGCDHGTHVAGIAAGKSASFSGVAKEANIIAIQVFSKLNSCPSPDDCITAFTSDIILGLERVLTLRSSFNIAAVNLSLGSGQFTSNCDTNPMKPAIDNLRSVGIATVIASGNDGSVNALSSPACISTAISVGSTGDGSSGATQDVVSSFSNSASFLNLLAPGATINSSVPGGGFANKQGTSMATPHVTGAWAVLKSKLPNATVTQILSALTSTGLPVTDTRNGMTKPRIKVDLAANALSAAPAITSVLPATVTAESCGTPNSALDPGETVTVNLPLRNIGSSSTANLVATLQATGSVTAPSSPQTYGVLTNGGPTVTRSFTFTADPTLFCGGTLTATLQLQDGAFDLGTVSFTFQLGVVSATAVTSTYSQTGAPVALPDVSIVEIPLTVSDTGVVSDVNVRVRLNHTFDADLAISLIGPDGTGVKLSTGNGGGGDNYGSGANDCAGSLTVFDDAAATSITAGSAPFSGTFRPEGLLSAFNGKLSNGVWKLRISDGATGDSGTLGCWQLEITRQTFICCSGLPCPTITLAPATVPDGTVSTAYSQTLTASGGMAPYSFAVTAGALPGGLMLSSSGVLSGTPNAAGMFTFTVTATAANGCTGMRSYTINITGTAGTQTGLLYVLSDCKDCASQIYGYAVNETTGALTLLPGFPVSTGGIGDNSPVGERLTIDRANRRLYAINDGSDTVSAFAINSTTGALTPLPFSPINLGSGDYYTLAVHPSGSPLVVGKGSNTTGRRLLSYQITATTAMAAAGSPYDTSNLIPISTVFSQDGNYVYTGGQTDTTGIAGYSVNPATGVLATLPGSLFQTGNFYPLAYATDTAGRLFVTNADSGQVRVFTTANGIPTGVSSNPFASGLQLAIQGRLHPNGFYLVADVGITPSPGRVGVYRINGSGSATTLTAVAGSPFALGSATPHVLALNQVGTFLFTANGTSYNLTTFSINTTTGALTLVSTQPVFGASGRLDGMAYLSAPCPTITLSPTTLPSGTAGTAYNQTVSASPSNSYSFAVTTGALPAGLSLNSATGAITGTPTIAGTSNFTIRATSFGSCSGNQTYTLTINNCPTITVAPTTLPNGTGGTAYSQTLTASGGTAPYNFTVTAGTLPGGLTLSSGGLLSGTPNAAGTFNFTITATDANGCTGTRSYTINITGTSGAQTGLLYVLNDCTGCGNRIYGYAVNEATGALTLLPGFPVSTGGNGLADNVSERLRIDRTNRRLYAINDGSDTVSAFAINPTTGALTPLPFSPINLGSVENWCTIAVHPSGSPLVVGANNLPPAAKLASYQITATTATAAAGSPYNTGNAQAFSSAFSQDGNYVYTGGNTLIGSIAGFSVNSATGVLTALAGSPFDSGGGAPNAYATDAAGRFFVGNYTQVRVFTTANGIPTAVSGNPFASGLERIFNGLLHPNGFYLVADGYTHVGVYRINGNGSATTLTAVAGSPFLAGGSETDVLTLTRAGTFLFTADSGTRNLTTFSVNTTTGALTLLGMQPVNALGTSGRLTGMAYLPLPRLATNLDFNGDGNADIVGRNQTTGDVQVGLSDGTKILSSSSWGNWSLNYDIYFVDMNGDGKADIVGRHKTTADVQVGLSDGTRFLTPTRWCGWSLAYDIRFADMNGDGKADLIGRHQTTGDVQVGLSDGTKILSSTRWCGWNLGYDIHFADMNGDGKADLIGRHQTTGDVQVGLSDGTKILSSTRWCGWSLGYDIHFADMNGDGKADLIGRNLTTGDVQVGLSDGTKILSSSSWGSWSLNYDIHFADMNGDGKADIGGRNQTTADVQVGLSDGTKFLTPTRWCGWGLSYDIHLEQ